jgi:hypothetical protein
MKLVFTHAEVAEALGKSVAEFDALRPSLEELGFPKPVAGLGACWSIMEVIRWVNGEGSSMMAAHLLSDEDDQILEAEAEAGTRIGPRH